MAEAKFRAEPEEYSRLIRARDSAAILDLLTDRAVELKARRAALRCAALCCAVLRRTYFVFCALFCPFPCFTLPQEHSCRHFVGGPREDRYVERRQLWRATAAALRRQPG